MINKKARILLKILLVINVIALVLLVIYVYINKKYIDSSKENKTVNDTEVINKNDNDEFLDNELYGTVSEFDTKGSENMFVIHGIQNTVYNNKNYTKVDLSMNNDTDSDIPINQYLFSLVDENRKTITNCYTRAFGNIDATDIFPAFVIANSLARGYLYCSSVSENAKYLKINYITDPIKEDNGTKPSTEEHYLEFQNIN